MRVLHIFILYIYIFSPHFYFLGGKGVIKLLYPLLLMIFFSQDVRTLIYKNKKSVTKPSKTIVGIFAKTIV